MNLNPIKAFFSQYASKIYLGVFIALVILVSIFYFSWKSSLKDVTRLNGEVKQLNIDNTTLKDENNKLKQSNEVDNSVQNNTVIEKKVYVDKLVENKKATQDKIDAIEQKYKDKETNAANTQAKYDEISQVRLESMWNIYCQTDPDKCNKDNAK